MHCGYTLEAVLTSTHNLCFEQKYEKYRNFLSENFLVVKFLVYLNRHVFVIKSAQHKWNCHTENSRNVRNVASCMCAQRRFGSACAFAMSYQNIHFWIAHDAMYLMRTTKTLIRLDAQADLNIRRAHMSGHHETCLYNFDPLKPHFYIVKLGFIGVYIIFLISAQKHRLWVLVRTASSRRF